MSHHIELIDPMEKVSPSLGGTGYVGPKEPADAATLAANASWASEKWPELNAAVWKVLRTSVGWKRIAQRRRLKVDGRTIPCVVLGGIREWWFVSVDAREAARILSANASPGGEP